MTRTDDELRSMLLDLESEQVERKESLSSSRDRVSQAICAFANDLPGYGTSGVVFIGATDDGRVGGTPITDQLLLDLAGMRDRGQILPLPQLAVRKLAVEDAQPRGSGRCENSRGVPPVGTRGTRARSADR